MNGDPGPVSELEGRLTALGGALDHPEGRDLIAAVSASLADRGRGGGSATVARGRERWPPCSRPRRPCSPWPRSRRAEALSPSCSAAAASNSVPPSTFPIAEPSTTTTSGATGDDSVEDRSPTPSSSRFGSRNSFRPALRPSPWTRSVPGRAGRARLRRVPRGGGRGRDRSPGHRQGPGTEDPDPGGHGRRRTRRLDHRHAPRRRVPRPRRQSSAETPSASRVTCSSGPQEA